MRLAVELTRDSNMILTCLLDDEGPHEWSTWTHKKVEVWKSYSGFGETQTDYKGSLIEQTRNCKICRKIELDVQG